MTAQSLTGLLLSDHYRDPEPIRMTWFGNDWVTLIVAALDLALMVPALTAGGLLLWRRRPWGYVIAALASIQGALYLLVLSVNSIVAIRRGLASVPCELPIWATLLVVTTAIALGLLASIQRERVALP
jgi:hypothetical protein